MSPVFGNLPQLGPFNRTSVELKRMVDVKVKVKDEELLIEPVWN